MALPIATGVLFDTIIPEGQRNALVQMSVILLASSVAIFLMRLGQSFATQRMEGRMQSELEAALWDRLLNMRTGFFRNYTTGDLARRSLAVNHIREMLTGTVITSLLSGIFSVSSLVLLFYYSPSLALLALGLVSIAVMYGRVQHMGQPEAAAAHAGSRRQGVGTCGRDAARRRKVSRCGF